MADLSYWYLHLTGEGSAEMVVKVGLIPRAIRDNGTAEGRRGCGHMLKGGDIDTETPAAQLLYSGAGLAGALSRSRMAIGMRSRWLKGTAIEVRRRWCDDFEAFVAAPMTSR
jgi:hypothetical protein